MYVCLYVCLYVCMYACMYACMYLCLYVCLYACILHAQPTYVSHAGDTGSGSGSRGAPRRAAPPAYNARHRHCKHPDGGSTADLSAGVPAGTYVCMGACMSAHRVGVHAGAPTRERMHTQTHKHIHTGAQKKDSEEPMLKTTADIRRAQQDKVRDSVGGRMYA